MDSDNSSSLPIKTFVAECLASFVFGFAVYSAILSSILTNQVATPVIVGLAVGLSSIVIIYAFSDITVAHFNPAITLPAIIFRKIPILKGTLYILSQFLGFMLAAAVILGCYPGNAKKNLETIRSKKSSSAVSQGNMICTELFLTGILTFVAFSVAINAPKKKSRPRLQEEQATAQNSGGSDESPDITILAPLIIGLTLGFLAFLGFSSSGGVFNPGLVWAPVLYTGSWYNSWCYWLGEFLGGFLGAAIQVYIFARIESQ